MMILVTDTTENTNGLPGNAMLQKGGMICIFSQKKRVIDKCRAFERYEIPFMRRSAYHARTGISCGNAVYHSP